jgi:hypothetical protein
MERIGMEAQGGKCSPPRPVADQARLRSTYRGPIYRQSVPALRAEEEQQPGAIGQRCVDCVPGRSGRERLLS